MTDKLAKTDDTALLKAAIDQGATPEALEKLLTLHERIADRKAAMEFAAQLADFQASCPPIPKQSTARIATKGGVKYSYKYAELDTIANTVRPKLHGLGFSYSWDSAEDKGQLSVTCTLRHVNGHSVTSSFSCPTDSAAPVTGAQKTAMANTYAKRQSLIQVLGLTTCDPDNDAGPGETAAITAKQAADIEALIEDVEADKVKFLAYLQVDAVDAIPANDFARAVAALKRKRK